MCSDGFFHIDSVERFSRVSSSYANIDHFTVVGVVS